VGMVENRAAVALRYADLGEVRRNQRLVQLVSALAAIPSHSLPQAGGTWAATKAACRLWANPTVSAQAIGIWQLMIKKVS